MGPGRRAGSVDRRRPLRPAAPARTIPCPGAGKDGATDLMPGLGHLEGPDAAPCVDAGGAGTPAAGDDARSDAPAGRRARDQVPSKAAASPEELCGDAALRSEASELGVAPLHAAAEAAVASEAACDDRPSPGSLAAQPAAAIFASGLRPAIDGAAAASAGAVAAVPAMGEAGAAKWAAVPAAESTPEDDSQQFVACVTIVPATPPPPPTEAPVPKEQDVEGLRSPRQSEDGGAEAVGEAAGAAAVAAAAGEVAANVAREEDEVEEGEESKKQVAPAAEKLESLPAGGERELTAAAGPSALAIPEPPAGAGAAAAAGPPLSSAASSAAASGVGGPPLRLGSGALARGAVPRLNLAPIARDQELAALLARAQTQSR
jgi:hypothetical protein